MGNHTGTRESHGEAQGITGEARGNHMRAREEVLSVARDIPFEPVGKQCF